MPGLDPLAASVRALARQLASLCNVELRVSYLRHRLLEMPEAALAELLMWTLHGAEARDLELLDLLQSLSLALADPSCAPTREAVARLLDAAGQQTLAMSIWTAPGPAEQEEGARVNATGRGGTLTLGERKALARQQDRNLIARAVRDPHPDVIHILLGNPALTEAEVLRLCSRRPVPAEVLREVFRSPRWLVRYPVKVALTLNPYTPLDMRLQLVPHLTRQDLGRVLEDGALPPVLEQACQRMVQPDTIH